MARSRACATPAGARPTPAPPCTPRCPRARCAAARSCCSRSPGWSSARPRPTPVTWASWPAAGWRSCCSTTRAAWPPCASSRSATRRSGAKTSAVADAAGYAEHRSHYSLIYSGAYRGHARWGQRGLGPVQRGAPVTHDDNAAPDHRMTAAEVTDGDWADALRAHEQQFWREFGRAPVGLVMASLTADRRCAYLAVNVTYCQLTGYSRQELSGSDFLSCFHPQDQPALEVLIDDVTSGASAQIEADARLVRADGEIVWVHLTGSVRRWPAGQRYLAIFVQDSTAAWQARAEIQRLQHELQQTRRLASLGQLVGGISHDFSNTLTVIANYASLVRDEVIVAETTESAAKWGPVRWDVEQIEEAADEAKRLIKHLLAFARREEGEPILLDLGQTISDATGLLVEVLGEHVLLATGQSEGLWPVQADPGLLKQAILNIAVNARDAMPGGGQVVIDAVNIDMEDLPADWQDAADLAELLPGRYVAFRVTDAGTGMDAITAERAFEPFFSTKNGDRAAGLGLPAVRRFATQAGGKAWLHSELGQGTTVTVVLPAAGQAGWHAAAQQGRAPESAGTILV